MAVPRERDVGEHSEGDTGGVRELEGEGEGGGGGKLVAVKVIPLK